MASRAIPSNLVEEQWTQNHPQYFRDCSLHCFQQHFLEIAVASIRDLKSEKRNSDWQLYHLLWGRSDLLEVLNTVT